MSDLEASQSVETLLKDWLEADKKADAALRSLRHVEQMLPYRAREAEEAREQERLAWERLAEARADRAGA